MAINWDSQRIPVRASERKKGPYPYYGAQGIVDYVDDYIFDGFYILVAEDGENLRSQKENVATLASGKFWVNNHAHVISSKPHCNTKYIFYALSDIDFTSYITGSTIPKLSQASLGNIELPCPSLEVQDAIASTLGSLDDKIDLNRRTNETLEAMARALFRDWFVDFGPTRAKMAGEAPYLAPELWELFPDRLDDEGKPEGWKTEPLDEIATFLNGLALQKYPSTGDTSLPAIKIAQLRSENTETADPVSPDIPDDYIIEQNDLLFSWSGSLLCKFWNGQRGALNQHLFKVTSKRFEPWFIYEWIQFYMPEFQAIAAAKATTMGHIQRRHLTESLVTIPPANIMQPANKAIGSLIEQIQSNNGQSRTLAQLRDLLLPKLMSGEISIRDAEKMVEDAT
ncbi:restriction endonuclease subunit S [Acetobacter cerevisiae]|uniref:Restriction endonuclease subunit S n=1 Tax=Acetobacter cerevisiae TaxID=178900 RepID=A0ABT1EV87_9PROT|nr:restriction endonuclease subunit S [Acetobacter cerevisiae]MCP1247199.1 restriction endonuclease subunit S [Acetobacter cerevisiae]MCP1256759.1 restriction endonuclease subunit S [Acetobacter cerevisiae]